MNKEITYQSAIEEIEKILGEIENDIVDIDTINSKVNRVSELLNFCKGKLRKTEEEVEKVIKSIDE